MDFAELNADQRRETVNTQQRFRAFCEAADRLRHYRGSMVWSRSKGHEYLTRAAYAAPRRRRQTSLGLRSPETERIKRDFEQGRASAEARLEDLRLALERQVAINRVLGLGRVPRLGARIIRALDANGLLGAGIRVLGTYALYAYEAAAGVHVDPSLTSTDDIDLLLDPRARLSILSSEKVMDVSLLGILKRVDRSFERARQTFRAVNRDGYMVDFVKPLRSPPWTDESTRISNDPADMTAVEITGLEWLEAAPPFEAVAVDDRGEPLRIVTCDPRVFAAHKHWLWRRTDREPIKRRRDAQQAATVAALVATYLPHLDVDPSEMRMLPRDVFEAALPLFVSAQTPENDPRR